MILAGDIGGTHTRLALFEKGKRLVMEKFSSQDYSSLAEIVEEFSKTHGKKVKAACFGVAGPIRGGKCEATNLAWIVDAKRLAKVLNLSKVALLNDLEANAYGIRVLKKEELLELHRGASQKGNQALIAAGTGLGEAGMYWNGKEHFPFACEGGHADFAARNEKEFELFQYLKEKYEHVSYERVVSGPGLHEIYQFLTEKGYEKSSMQVEAEMAKKDPSRVITEQTKDPACAHAVDWFLSCYGAEAGNLALKFLALGGLFIGGGIAPILAKKMKEGAFYTAFIEKGRFQPLLESIPIHVILNDSAALLGAAYYAEHK